MFRVFEAQLKLKAELSNLLNFSIYLSCLPHYFIINSLAGLMRGMRPVDFLVLTESTRL